MGGEGEGAGEGGGGGAGRKLTSLCIQLPLLLFLRTQSWFSPFAAFGLSGPDSLFSGN